MSIRAMKATKEIAFRYAQKRQLPEDETYDDGFLRVEHNNYYIACGEVPLRLPRTEFLILSRLAKSAGRIVTAEDLWACVWGDQKPLNSESLHVYIYRLRNKLVLYNLFIDTMVNVGYRLIVRDPIR